VRAVRAGFAGASSVFAAAALVRAGLVVSVLAAAARVRAGFAGLVASSGFAAAARVRAGFAGLGVSSSAMA
jgi:hypothetical protein